MLIPGEIAEKRFKTSFRGFDPREVIQFLNLVAQELQRLIDENNRLKQSAQKQEDFLNEFRAKEDTLKNALISSQKLGDQIGLRLDGFQAPALSQFGCLHRVTGCDPRRLSKQVHGCRERAAHSGGLQ